MTTWQLVRIFAGTLILISLALGMPQSPLFISSNWLWLTAFLGINLFQSGFTKWCLSETIFAKLGVKSGT